MRFTSVVSAIAIAASLVSAAPTPIVEHDHLQLGGHQVQYKRDGKGAAVPKSQSAGCEKAKAQCQVAFNTCVAGLTIKAAFSGSAPSANDMKICTVTKQACEIKQVVHCEEKALEKIAGAAAGAAATAALTQAMAMGVDVSAVTSIFSSLASISGDLKKLI